MLGSTADSCPREFSPLIKQRCTYKPCFEMFGYCSFCETWSRIPKKFTSIRLVIPTIFCLVVTIQKTMVLTVSRSIASKYIGSRDFTQFIRDFPPNRRNSAKYSSYQTCLGLCLRNAGQFISCLIFDETETHYTSHYHTPVSPHIAE